MLVFNIFGSLAQFERDLIRERINAGLKAAVNEEASVVDARSSRPTSCEGTRPYRGRADGP